MVFRNPLRPDQRALVLLLNHEKKYSQREIASIANISKSSVFDVIKKAEQRGGKEYKITFCKRGGRPEILDERDKRRLQRAVKILRERDANFTVMEVVQTSGIDINRASYRTFVRYIRKLGYGF